MAAAVHDDHWMRPLEEVYFSQGLRRAGIVLGVPREPHLLGSQARVQLNLDRRIPVSSVLVAQARPGKAGLVIVVREEMPVLEHHASISGGIRMEVGGPLRGVGSPRSIGPRYRAEIERLSRVEDRLAE